MSTSAHGARVDQSTLSQQCKAAGSWVGGGAGGVGGSGRTSGERAVAVRCPVPRSPLRLLLRPLSLHLLLVGMPPRHCLAENPARATMHSGNERRNHTPSTLPSRHRVGPR